MRERERNIVLVGFRATGKTAVGRRLAERLGYTFVDLDAAIEAEAGMSIPRVFTERGEAALRELAAQVVERVANQKRCVIAMGGGTIDNPANLRALRESGVVVRLAADLETTLPRVSAADRPVRQGEDLRTHAEQSLAERHDAYAPSDVTLDTTAQTIDDVVDSVLHAVKAGPFRAPNSPQRS